MKDRPMLSEEEKEALLGGDFFKDLSFEKKMEMVLDFPLTLSVRLGNARRTFGELQNLQTGNVIELDRTLFEPVDIIVNGRLIARGEVGTIDETFGIKVTSIISQEDRLKESMQL